MQKNKMILALVVAIAIVVTAFSGCVTQVSEEGPIQVVDILSITGTLSSLPSAIEVSNSNPFYPLIVTPLAINYDEKGEQHVSPLYIVNISDPSEAIIRTKEMVGITPNLIIDNSKSAKEWSLEIAREFWKKSQAAMLIQDNKSGYTLAINAIPIASYLSIPVIVTDEIDKDVKKTLDNLGVKFSIICGNLPDYKRSLKFTTVEEIVNASIILVKEKFGDVDYITLANPIDAWPPKVLDSREFSFGPEVVKSSSMNSQSTIKFFIRFFKGATWNFTIPTDYKYALIEFDGYNHELEGVNELGDCADFSVDSEDGLNIIWTSTRQGIPVRDTNGNIIEDKVHVEIVLYDYGGKNFKVSAHGHWSLKDEGKVSAHVTIKKLENPVYEMMRGLSEIAPYLAAYHKGIIFAKPEFAFTADDNVLTDEGKRCPGVYVPGRNPALVSPSNRHIYDKIHIPLNKLLAKLAGIQYDKTSGLKRLQEYYKNNPVYIAIVGGTVAVPRYLYENAAEPIEEASPLFGGGGTNSDNIYADIDPMPYNWSNQAGDLYSKYPFLENIVGRITGWDVQDASALIVRTFFYDKIIKHLTDWKDNFGNLFGGGLDFRKPLVIQILNHIPGLKQAFVLLDKISGGFVNLDAGPWKYDTGFSKIMAKAFEDKIGKELGFNVKTAFHESAILDGLSDKALDELKKVNMWNKLTFPKSQIKELLGEEKVKGREILESSNFIWLTGHGCPYNFGLDGPDAVAAGFDGIILNAPKLWQKIFKNTFIPHFVGGFWGPGGWLGRVGEYNPRSVSTVNFGPSFMWLESCLCAKITGMYPKNVISQTILHSGVNALIASTTGSNIPGGYLPGKNHMWDTWIGTKLR